MQSNTLIYHPKNIYTILHNFKWCSKYNTKRIFIRYGKRNIKIYIGIGITLIFLGNAIHGWKYHNHKKNKQSEKKEGNLSRQTEQIVYKQIFGQEENSGYNHNYQIYKKEREEKKAKKEKTKEIVKEVKKIQKNNKKEEKKYPRKNRGKHA